MTDENFKLLDLWESEARHDLQKHWNHKDERLVFLTEELKKVWRALKQTTEKTNEG